MRCRHWIVAGCLVAAVASTHWLKLNVSPSVPVGVYGLTAVPAQVERGMLVLLPSPATMAFWHPWWIPLLKPVAAVAGEMVCVQEGMLRLGDADYGPVYAEAHGRTLPHLAEGCQVVPAGSVFLASMAPKSLDGRYMGMTPVATLTAQAHPLWTWR